MTEFELKKDSVMFLGFFCLVSLICLYILNASFIHRFCLSVQTKVLIKACCISFFSYWPIFFIVSFVALFQ